MEWLYTAGTIIAGIIIRLGLPFGITAVMVLILLKLDRHWQSEVERQPELNQIMAKNPGCWKIKNCSPDLMGNCPARSQPDMPCWQVKRQKGGLLQGSCLDCKVFREALVPTSV
jgi:hypothetical protein